MSYDSEVLIDAPVWYIKCDDLAAAELLDYAGGDYHIPTLPEAVFGIAGPVYTDSPNLGAASEVVGGGGGIFGLAQLDPVPEEIDPRLNLTYELCGYATSGNAHGNQLRRSGSAGGGDANKLEISGSTATFKLHFASGDFSLTSPTLSLPDWYHLVGTRFHNVMTLMVQGLIVAQRDDLPFDEEIEIGTDNGWLLGSVAGADVCPGVARVAVYDYALSQPRALVHHEARLLNPPITLRADLHFNCTLEIDDEPTPVLFPFRPDWGSPIRETLSFLTDIRTARQDYEQRAALRQRPRRDLEFQALVLDNAQRRRFRAYLRAHQQHNLYLPVWTDESSLTAAAAAGADELDFESEFLDFNDGGKLALYEDENNFEILEIDTVGDSSTTLAGETLNDWTTQTRAIPVVRALIDTSLQIVRLTDAMEEGPLNFRVLAEDVPLAPHRLGTYSPRYTYEGVEVFDPLVLGTNNWNEDGRGEIAVRAADPESPAGIFSRDAQDTASREITSYSFFLDGREDLARFLAWWYSMKGRLNPIWVPTLQEDFDPISSAFGNVTVAGNDYTNFYQDQANRRDLVFVYHDESMLFRRVDDVTAGADQETFDLGSLTTLSNLLCLSFLKLCRLNEDSIELAWHTDRLVEVTVNFIDLLTTP